MADSKKRNCCPLISPLVIAAAVCGILLSITASLVVRRYVHSLDQAEFKRQITVYLATVERRRRNTEDLLRTFRSLLAFHPNLTREQFQETFQDIIHRPENAGSFGWAPLIPYSRRANAEAKMPEFKAPCREFNQGEISHAPNEHVVRAHNRPEYLPIRFIEPYEGQEHLVGLDFLHIPEIADTIRAVRTGGDIRVSPRINIRFEDHVQPGLVAVIPIYRPTLEPDSEQERNSQFIENNREFIQLSISKKVTLNLQLDTNLPPVLADPTQLQQILMNLAINASEAMHNEVGTITIHTRLFHASSEFLATTHHPHSLEPGNYPAIEVQDTGCGMTEEIISRVFEPFHTTKFAGRGLGLSAVLGIVRSHQGLLHVTSQPNQGSRFLLLLPPTSGTTHDEMPAPTQEIPYPNPGLILLADDEPAVRKVAAKLLTNAGFTVKTAADGFTAIETFKESPELFQALIIDLTMPRMDGATAINTIQHIRPNIPILIMSGYSESDTVKLACSSPLTAFIQKPFGPQDLLHNLKSLIETQKSTTNT